MLDLLVPLQVAGMGEAAAADGAAEGSLSGVHIAVDVQLALAHEPLAAEQAGVGLLPGVPGQVLPQVRLQEEALGADGAAVQTLHGDSVVEGQMEAAGEGLVVAVVGRVVLARRAVKIHGGVDTRANPTTRCSWNGIWR